MPRGGKRDGAGRKPKDELAGEKLPALPTDKDEIGELIRTLEADPKDDEATANLRAAGWRRFWDHRDSKVALQTRIFLYDHWRGKARHTVNHLHDKPIEVNHTLSISAELEAAFARAKKR